LIATTLTQAFIKGEFIGGGDDIVDLNKRGVLLEKCRLALS
jgi:glutaredoxin-related protein